MKKNTILCCNLKTKLQNDALMKPGRDYRGILRRDLPNEDFGFDGEHYSFTETITSFVERRNPRVFAGEFITVTRRADGSLRPNLRPMTVGAGFNLDSYVVGVAEELRRALKDLIEE